MRKCHDEAFRKVRKQLEKMTIGGNWIETKKIPHPSTQEAVKTTPHPIEPTTCVSFGAVVDPNRQGRRGGSCYPLLISPNEDDDTTNNEEHGVGTGTWWLCFLSLILDRAVVLTT